MRRPLYTIKLDGADDGGMPSVEIRYNLYSFTYYIPLAGICRVLLWVIFILCNHEHNNVFWTCQMQP